MLVLKNNRALNTWFYVYMIFNWVLCELTVVAFYFFLWNNVLINNKKKKYEKF